MTRQNRTVTYHAKILVPEKATQEKVFKAGEE